MFLSELWWSHRCKPSFPLHSSHFHGFSGPANSNLLPHILHILLVSFLYTLTTICHTMFYFLLCTLYILLVQCLAHRISYINICQINKVSNTVLKCSFAYSPLANNSFCSNSSMNTKLKTSRQHKLMVKMQSNFSI